VPSEKEEALLRSQAMLQKFDNEDKLENSFEVEAASVGSDEIEIVDDPIIQVEESEKLIVKPAPEDSKVLIQPMEEEKDKELVPLEEEPLKVSEINDDDKARILYIEKVSGNDYNPMFRDNLNELMNMGFVDFEKNRDLLEKNHNNLELVCSKLFD